MNIEYKVQAYAHQTEYGGWQPAIRVFQDGKLQYSEVFELTFTEAKYCLPYARMLAQNKVDMLEMAAQMANDHWPNGLDDRP